MGVSVREAEGQKQEEPKEVEPFDTGLLIIRSPELEPSTDTRTRRTGT